MAYKNQFSVTFSKCRLVEIIEETDVDFSGNDEPTLKVVAVVAAIGPERQDDELEVTAFGKRAEILLEMSDGDLLYLEGNIRTRWIDRADGNGTWSATEFIITFVRRESDKRSEGSSRVKRRNGDGTEESGRNNDKYNQGSNRRGGRQDKGPGKHQDNAGGEGANGKRHTGNRSRR